MTVKESKLKAIDAIVQILTKDNVDMQFKHINVSYYSKDRFIINWLGYANDRI